MAVSSLSRSCRLMAVELEPGGGTSAVRPERALNLVALCITRSSGSRRSINNAGRTLPLFKPPAAPAPIFFFRVGSAAAMRFAAVTAATALASVGTWAVGLSSPRF